MSDPEQLKIGALAERAGTTAPTIRYYESIGLLPLADRPTGTQRRYGAADLTRLTFIRRCREFGFPIDQIRALVTLMDDPTSDCTDAREIVHVHLESVRAKLNELRALETTIADFAERCDTTCLGGPGSECVPLVHLARPSMGPSSETARSPTRRRLLHS